MVRSSVYRTSKYSAKLVGDVIKNRIDAQRDDMVAQVSTQFGNLQGIEESVKTLLEGWGVGTIMVPWYMAFGRECYGITRKHSGDIAHDEVCIALQKWTTRFTDAGLTEADVEFYLGTIAMDVFTVNVWDCT